MFTGFKFLIIFRVLFPINLNVLSLEKNSDLQCAFRNSLCDPKLKRPCCNVKDFCTKTGAENYYRCIEKVGLGKFCFRDDGCEEIKHAKCSADNKCICRDKNIQIDENTCGPTLGGFCWKNESCVTSNAVCIDSECQCDLNYSPRMNNQCVMDVLGTDCKNDRICQQVKFAKCSDNVCKCSKNTIPINRHHCGAVLEGFCWSSDDCLPSHSECINNKCQCENLYVPENNEKCSLAHIGMSCKHDSDCYSLIPYSVCFLNKNCHCKNEYYKVNNRECRQRTEYNIFCHNNKDCTRRNYECIDNKCQCKPNFNQRGPECIADRLYESCNDHLDCSGIENSVCSADKICACDQNYAAWNEISCKPILGGNCTEDSNCFAVNSVCIDKKCQCKGIFYKYSNGLCLSPRLGAVCKHNDDCGTILNAVCSENRRCECMYQYGQYNITACAPLLGRFCQGDKLCAPVNSVCSNSVCKCKEGYFRESDAMCVPGQFALRCSIDEDCKRISGAICINNTCVCNSNHMILDGIACAPLIGEYCERNRRCAPDNSLCIDNECQCMKGFSRYFNHRCVPKTGHFNVSCDRDDHCNDIKFAECSRDKKCACKQNYVTLGEDKCIALLGEYCEADYECIYYNSVCVEHKCQCPEKFYMQTQYQCGRIPLGRTCQSNFECTVAIQNSECSDDEVCVCKKDYHAYNEFECLPFLYESCSTNDQCRFNSSVCVDNKCQCEAPFRSVSASQCVRMGTLFTCRDNLDCGDPWHYKCSGDKKCICNVNNILINKSTCSPILGGYCWTDHQCVVKNSKCIDFKCQCRDNFNPVAPNRCMPIS